MAFLELFGIYVDLIVDVIKIVCGEYEVDKYSFIGQRVGYWRYIYERSRGIRCKVRFFLRKSRVRGEKVEIGERK